jgi:hypothetical protein
MLYGLPWTSGSYPWPLGENGAPLGPILQLNLNLISLMTDRQCGSGLLQIFMPSHSEPYYQTDYGEPCVSRIVPWDAIERESKPTPFPWEKKRPLEILTELSIDWDLSNEDLEIPRSYDDLSKLRRNDLAKAERVESVLANRMARAGFFSNAYELGPAELIFGWHFETYWLFLTLAALPDEVIVGHLRESEVLHECDDNANALENFETWMSERYFLEDESRLLSGGISHPKKPIHALLFPNRWVTQQTEEYIPQGNALPLIECSGPDGDFDLVGVNSDFDALLLRSPYG